MSVSQSGKVRVSACEFVTPCSEMKYAIIIKSTTYEQYRYNTHIRRLLENTVLWRLDGQIKLSWDPAKALGLSYLTYYCEFPL